MIKTSNATTLMILTASLFISSPIARATTMTPVSGYLRCQAIVDQNMQNSGTLTLTTELGSFSHHVQAQVLSGFASCTVEMDRTADSIMMRNIGTTHAGSPPHSVVASGHQEDVFDIDLPTTVRITATRSDDRWQVFPFLKYPDGSSITLYDNTNGQQLQLSPGRYTLMQQGFVNPGASNAVATVGLTIVPEPSSLPIAGAALALAKRRRQRRTRARAQVD